MKLKTKYKLLQEAGISIEKEKSIVGEKEVYFDWGFIEEDHILRLMDLVEHRTWVKAAKLAQDVEPMLSDLFYDYAEDLDD